MPLPRPNLLNLPAIQTAVQQISQSTQIPAPVGGWNQLDSIAAMDPVYALQLDNVFPTAAECKIRKGYTPYATGMSGQVETLFEYGGTSSQKLLAANGGNIYDISSGGAVGAALATGYTSNRWQYVNFGTGGTTYVWACNGSDAPFTFNGSSVSTPTLSGVTASTINNVAVFKNRLFFVLNNSLSFGYLPISAIQGAISTFDLSGFFPRGGKLVAIGTWSRAGLTQQDDLCVFLTNQGEFIVYQGDDPSTSLEWSEVNRGRIGAPVGARSMVKIGSDLYIVCQDGLVALSQVLWLDRVDTSKTISVKIGTAINEAVGLYSANFGWQSFLYPKGNLVMVNVPISEGSTMRQYVVNTATGAWCRFTNVNANCWALYNDTPYFGSTDGKVYQFDNGYTDNGANVQWEARGAFVNMGTPGQNKRWTLVRPIFRANGTVSINIALEVDYQTINPTAAATSNPSQSQWNSARWNVDPWSGGSTVQLIWGAATGIGRLCAIHMKGNTRTALSWVATDFTFDEGGLI